MIGNNNTLSGSTIKDKRFAADLKIRAKFPSLNRELVVAEAEIRRGDRSIGSAAFTINPSFIDFEWVLDLITGTPVSLEWRAMGLRGSFHGYLYLKDGQDVTSSDLMIVGVGYPLLRRHGHSFPFNSAGYAIRNVCNSHYLSASTSMKNVVQQNVSQGDMTDWEWMKELTRRQGLSCHFRGTTFVAHELEKVRDFSVVAPLDVVIPNKGPFSIKPQSATRVRSFMVHKNDSDDKDDSSNSAYASMTYNGNFYNSATTPVAKLIKRESSFSTATTTSPMDSDEKISQHEYDSRWDDIATLKMDCNPNIEPLDVVRTWSSKGVMKDVWTVLDIKHVFREHDAVTTFRLGRERVYSSFVARRSPITSRFAYGRAIKTAGSKNWFSDPELRVHPSIEKFGEYIWAPRVVE